MTPLYLNSPLPDLNQQHQFLLSPNYENSALSPQSSFFFNTEFGCLHQDHQIVDYTSQSRFSDPKAPPSSSSIAFEAGVNDEVEDRCDVEGSALKVRIVQKMIKPSENGQKPLKYTLRFQDQQPNYNESSQSGRVCSDCNTTTTPLWRSGPKGPKSLCNACGIRQRKARRAMAAAEAAMGSGSTAEAKPSKVHNVRDKKLRPGHCKKLGNNVAQKPKISFKNFAFDFANKNNSAVLRPGFSQDVEQAALMLMDLSCGFLQG